MTDRLDRRLWQYGLELSKHWKLGIFVLGGLVGIVVSFLESENARTIRYVSSFVAGIAFAIASFKAWDDANTSNSQKVKELTDKIEKERAEWLAANDKEANKKKQIEAEIDALEEIEGMLNTVKVKFQLYDRKSPEWEALPKHVVEVDDHVRNYLLKQDRLWYRTWCQRKFVEPPILGQGRDMKIKLFMLDALVAARRSHLLGMPPQTKPDGIP